MSEPEKEEQPREPDGTARPASNWSTAGGDAATDPSTTSHLKNADAEEALLGRMLHQDFGAEAIAEAQGIVTPQSFFATPNAIVYRRAVEMRQRGEPVDWVSLAHELKQQGEDAMAADGAASIEERLRRLVDAVPSGADAAHYARIVLQFEVRRRFVEACERGKRDGASTSIPLELAKESLLRDVEELRSRSSPRVAFQSVDELIAKSGSEIDFIVRLLVPDRSVLLVVGKPKSGKSVFVFALLGALERGEDFCGRSTVTTTAVVLSEEDGTTIGQKARRFGVTKARFLTRADLAKCSNFEEVIRVAVEEAKRVGARVLVIDTFAAWVRFGRDEEKDAGACTEAMRPLMAAAAQGLSVIAIHHARKGDAAGGDGVRGSGAIFANADSLIELARVDSKSPASAVRRLTCTSRFEGLPPEVYVELKEDRFVEVDRPEVAQEDDLRRRILDAVRAASPARLTREEILETVGGNAASVGAALKAMAEAGQIGRDGEGRKGKPFRFFALPPDDQFHSIPPPTGERTESNGDGGSSATGSNGSISKGPDSEDGVVDLGEDLDDGVGAGP